MKIEIMKKVKVNDISVKKLYNYVQAVKDECGGFLIGERDIKNGLYKITDIIFLRLRVSNSADDNAIFEFMKNYPKLSAKVIGWWHTHPSFNTFFSQVDENTFKVLKDLFEMPIGVVINKYNDWNWAYIDTNGFMINLKDIESSKDKNLYEIDDELVLEAKNKIKDVKKTKITIDKTCMDIIDLDLDLDDINKNEFFTIPPDHKMLNKFIKDNKLSKGETFVYEEETFEVL